MNKDDVKELIEKTLERHLGVDEKSATEGEMWRALAITAKNILLEKRAEFKKSVSERGAKRVYYISMEFLLGRSLKNNLENLGLADAFREAMSDFGFDIEALYRLEPDAGLGNGGLGRLAACFMDSLTSLSYPATGFSLLYEYGLFRQRLVDGIQVELPDVWLPDGEVTLIPRTDRTVKVRFGGKVFERWGEGHLEIVYENAEEVEALPYDMMISGGDTKAVNILRLWRAKNSSHFNMGLFSSGDYLRAVEGNTSAEIITKVLYPADNHTEGKLLRLTQQYFLVSASAQSIIRDHITNYKTLDTLPDKVSIHINDTHPALIVPELMRILVDDYFYTWERAWDIVTRTVSYTNHTVMPEALERWREDIFRIRLPRIYSIIKEINERFSKDAWTAFTGDWKTISDMAIIANGEIRMANLALVASHKINGVSRLHSEILKSLTFRPFYKMYPDRFTSVTNGVAHRRWLSYSNPRLANLISELIGDGYKKDASLLEGLKAFSNDASVLHRLSEIKHQNKEDFVRLIEKSRGVHLSPHSVFDSQIKRIHEYKRQLLSALNIIGLVCDLEENPNFDLAPHTFIFGGKAAPSYYMAKRIIRLICAVSAEIQNNVRLRDKLSVHFIEDYNVSIAESLIPASEISEQISLAGKEASGTGCMKLMMNGAVTIGTLDGANIEIEEAVGQDNIFIFGLTSDEVSRLWASGYNPSSFFSSSERLGKIIARLSRGFSGENFSDIVSYLLSSNPADPFMCLADFDSYNHTHSKVREAYLDRERWNRLSLQNIASSGYFSADRAIHEYAHNIWGISQI